MPSNRVGGKGFRSYTIYALSESEIKRLLAACGVMAEYIMFILAIRYGFRREDVVKIKVANVNLYDSTITFHELKKKRDRTIPIEPDVVVELRRYLGTLSKGTVYLFPFQDGSTAWRKLQEVCEVAKISIPEGRTGRPFHSLRGTCVKMRQAQGWNISEVAALIGDTTAVVQEHYTTVTPMELARKMAGAK